MPARTTKLRYRRIVADRATRALSRIFRLPSTSTVTFLLGLGASIWIIVGYAGLKIKENALRSANERRRNDRVKTHFQATLSNISFTVYALLPTLSVQLSSHLDVEQLTEELKGVAAATAAGTSKVPRMTDSGMASWAASSGSDTNSKSLESSAILSSHDCEREADKLPEDKADDGVQGLGIQTGLQQTQDNSSWVQEFSSTLPQAPVESDMSDMGATSAGEDGDTASTRSQSISLPPTSPSRSTAGLPNQDSNASPSIPAQQRSLDPPGHGEHSVSSPAPPSSISISGSNPSFTDQSSDAGSSPPYLHSPPGSPSVSPFRRPVRIERPSAGQAAAPPFKVEESSSIQGQSGGAQTQGPSDVPEAEPPAMEPKRTKAQLWNEIKVQSITRTMATMYLLPLLVLQTTSQLTLLSRLHLLRTLAAEHHGVPSMTENEDNEDDDVSTIADAISPSPSSLGRLMKAKEAVVRPWSYFSLSEMGLQDVADECRDSSADSTGVLRSIWSGITSSFVGQTVPTDSQAEQTSAREPLHARLDSETQRLFLCMSWWFLHVGWRILEETAAMAVEATCQALPLKKEMTLDDWNDTLTNIRRKMDESLSSSKLLHILLPPPSQAEFEALLARYPTESTCPFASPPYTPILTELLDETASHLTSIDFICVFSHSILLLQGALLSRVASEIYNQEPLGRNELQLPHATVVELHSKKLVQCLPTLTRWSKGVWQAMPDEAIDQLTGSHNVEAFTALVYGDFGSDL